MNVQSLLRRARSHPVAVTVLLSVLLLSMTLTSFVAFRIVHGSNGPISTPAPVAPYAFSGDVSQLPTTQPAPIRHPERAGPAIGSKTPIAPDPVVNPASPNGPAPGPGAGGDWYAGSFAGLNYANSGAGYPPDTTGDVGPTYFIQAVNTSIGIFRKSDGSRIAAFTFDEFWAAAHTGTACDNGNDGEPTIIWDSMADRWIVADLAFGGDGSAPPFYECIAVSKTGDPVVGGWYLYPIRTDDASHPWFADSPKMAIWPTGLFMSANMYLPPTGGAFQEVRAWAFNQADMEAGAPVHSVVVDLGTTSYFSMLPANTQVPGGGSTLGTPPPGRDEFFVDESETQYAYDIWQFHVDYTGGTSSFTGPTQVSQASYNVGSSTVSSTGNPLDTLSDRLMSQARYINSGGEHLWVSHSVRTGDDSSPEGIQWANIDVTGGTITTTPIDQQIYGNLNGDGVNRWMGSLALDQSDDMALGYSVTSPTVMPGIAYAGRFPADPEILTQSETNLVSGTGSQTNMCGGVTCTRWGDSSAMSIDPNDCDFWYTNEYYLADGGDWQTRILSMRLNPNCAGTNANTIVTPDPVTATVGDKVTLRATLTWQPNRLKGFPDNTVTTGISGATITFYLNLNPVGTAVTDANGVATLPNVSTSGIGAGYYPPGVGATYAGDGAFFSANVGSNSASLTLLGANQTINFPPIANHTYGDPDFPLGATASSGLPVSYSASGNCVITPDNAHVHLTGAGSCTVTASQMGNFDYNPAPDVSQTFSIARANQTINFPSLGNLTTSGAFFNIYPTASSQLPVTLTSSGPCTVSPTSLDFGATATVHTTGTGICSITASQSGDGNYGPATSVRQTILVFGVLAQGFFVIGDNSAAAAGFPTQTFWGAKWAKLNSLSGGSAPSAFKGFALNISPNLASCSGSWATDPGNSANPPAGPLPTYMAVIVTSSASQSGSQISGNIVHIVIVQTNAGYANDPGHAGTGTIVTTIC